MNKFSILVIVAMVIVISIGAIYSVSSTEIKDFEKQILDGSDSKIVQESEGSGRNLSLELNENISLKSP